MTLKRAFKTVLMRRKAFDILPTLLAGSVKNL